MSTQSANGRRKLAVNGLGRRPGGLIVEDGVKPFFGKRTIAVCPKCQAKWETVGRNGRLIEDSAVVCPNGHLSIVSPAGTLELRPD